MSGLLFRSLNKTTAAPTIVLSPLSISGTHGGIFGGSNYGNTWGALESTVQHDGTKFMMWYHRVPNPTDAGAYIAYAESTDGETWTGHTAISGIVTQVNSPEMYFDGTTYHLLVRNSDVYAGGLDYYTATSPTGPFTRVKAKAIAVGATGAFDQDTLYNPSIHFEGGTFYVFYDGRKGPVYSTGLATGPSLTNLTKQGKVFPDQIMSPSLHKSGSTYLAPVHIGDWGVPAADGLPTSMGWMTSSSLSSGWTKSAWLGRVYNVNYQEQIADPYILEVNGRTHLFFEQIEDQTDYSQFRMCHAVYPGTIAAFEEACRASPVSDTAPAYASGKVTLTLNAGATITGVTMDGVAATAVGSAGAVTAGKYYLSGTTLILGTTGKSLVQIAYPTVIPAWGAGANTSQGRGAAAGILRAGLTLYPNAYWTQAGDALTVNPPVSGVPFPVTATLITPVAGDVIFDGTHADRFTASLDGITWASSITVPAGESTIRLAVEAQSGDTALSARVGVPT